MKAVIIGRFQPFHRGHEYLIEEAIEDYEEVLVGIGSSDESRTRENPLSFQERKDMIESCYPGIRLFPVKDVGDAEEWVELVERKLSELGIDSPRKKVVSVGMNDWTESCFRKAGYRVRRYRPLDPEKYSATRIRELAVQGFDWTDTVPDCAVKVLREIGFERILKEEVQGD